MSYGHERLRLVGGLFICVVGVSLVAEEGLLLGVGFVQVGSSMGCILLCYGLDFVGFFIWFGLWCQLKCS